MKISINDHYSECLAHHYLISLFLKNYTVTHFIFISGLILVAFVHILKDVDQKKNHCFDSARFSKAFDSIVHDRLLYKISAMGAAMGASSATLKWFKSYLSGYPQAVRIGSTAILRKVVGKSTRDNPERYCG